MIAPCADFKSKRDFVTTAKLLKCKGKWMRMFRVPSVWEKTSIPVSGNNSDRKTHCLNSLNRYKKWASVLKDKAAVTLYVACGHCFDKTSYGGPASVPQISVATECVSSLSETKLWKNHLEILSKCGVFKDAKRNVETGPKWLHTCGLHVYKNCITNIKTKSFKPALAHSI